MATRTKAGRAYKRAMQSKSAAGMGKSRSPTKKRVTVAGLAGPKRKKEASRNLAMAGVKRKVGKMAATKGYGAKMEKAEKLALTAIPTKKKTSRAAKNRLRLTAIPKSKSRAAQAAKRRRAKR